MSEPPSNELSALSIQDPPSYGCTFLCGLSFDKLSDWRRHENRVHHQVELWRCDESSVPKALAPAGECGTLFSAADNFKSHLRQTHGIQVDEEYLEARHIHPNHQGSFWCGFCRKVIALEGMGIEALNQRFDHIRQHYADSQTIADWLGLLR